MFGVPKRFEINLDIKIKDFIHKGLKQNEKKRIKEAIKSVKMTYQIAGEEIPSLVNDEYRCQVIQFYEIELESIKDANFIANIYQGLIKPLCIMKFYDSKEEEYSFADKRLSHTEDNQIVIEDAYISQRYPYGLPSEGIEQFMDYVSFDMVKNKTDKLAFYREVMYKLYILEHKSVFNEAEKILRDNAWYSSVRARTIFQKYKELVKTKDEAAKAQINKEKIKANKEVKSAKEALVQEIQEVRG